MSPYVKVTSFPHYPNTLRQVLTNYQPPPDFKVYQKSERRGLTDRGRAVRVAPEQHLKSLSRRVQAEILLQGPYLPQQLICAAEPLSLSLYLYFGLSGFS